MVILLAKWFLLIFMVVMMVMMMVMMMVLIVIVIVIIVILVLSVNKIAMIIGVAVGMGTRAKGNAARIGGWRMRSSRTRRRMRKQQGGLLSRRVGCRRHG